MTPKTGNRREQSKAETRRLILDAAYELFEQKGYEKTTMRALAAKAGVGLGTIFQHFPDKAAILLAAFNEDLTGISRQAMASLPKASFCARLEHLARPIFAWYAARPDLARVLLKEGLFASVQTSQKLLEQEAAISAQAAGLFAEAKEAGELRPDLDFQETAEVVWAFYIFTLINGLRTGCFEADQLSAHFLSLLDQFLEGAGAR